MKTNLLVPPLRICNLRVDDLLEDVAEACPPGHAFFPWLCDEISALKVLDELVVTVWPTLTDTQKLALIKLFG